MNIHTELLKLYPDTKPVVIAGYECLYYKIETPAHNFDVFYVQKNEILFQIKCRDGYNEILLKELIKEIVNKDMTKIPANELTILTNFQSSVSPYTRIGVAPPALAHAFKHESKQLSEITFWVFPLLEGEFNGGESESDFYYINGCRGQNIDIVDWFRNGKIKIEANKAIKKDV